MSNAKNITNEQIKTLRAEAGEAGDLAQAFICDVALGRENAITTAEEWEDRLGGGGFDAHNREAIMAIDSEESARAECASVIADAQAMGDDAERCEYA